MTEWLALCDDLGGCEMTGGQLEYPEFVSHNQLIGEIRVPSLLLSQVFRHIRNQDSHQRRQQNDDILEDHHKRQSGHH